MIFAVLGAAAAVIAAILAVGWKLLDAINSQTAVIKALDAQRRSDEERRYSFEGLQERAEKLERSIERLRELSTLNTGHLAVAIAEAEVLNEILIDLREGLALAGNNVTRYRKRQSTGSDMQYQISAAEREVEAFLAYIGRFTELHGTALARVEELRGDAKS